MCSVEDLLYWIRAREELRKNKECYEPELHSLSLQPKYTPDLILHTYRFCNVRRADDRVSRWLRKNVLTKTNLRYDYRSFVMFTAFCRWNNWPPAIQAIMAKGLYPAKRVQWRAIGRLLDDLREAHEKAWTGAYMINAARAEGRTKAQFVTEIVIQEGLGSAYPKLVQALRSRRRRSVWEALTAVPNWGSFMAGQVVDDWGWTSLLAKAQDIFIWAPQGPGSLRGFNRLLNLPLRTPHDEEAWCSQLVLWRKQVIEQLGVEYENLTLMDLQNCLCETDKYLRVKYGEGRPRSIYRPEQGYSV